MASVKQALLATIARIATILSSLTIAITWLRRFGTARVQLGADKHFSLKNSQFDLLAPLYDQGDNLLFTQGSLHRTDERTQLNLGAGLRHFAPRYRLGANFFTDYDLSRDHVCHDSSRSIPLPWRQCAAWQAAATPWWREITTLSWRTARRN
uniref:inverse autotransporter beta domain-containing protein n=1 Tax=Serratia symbiotica TaxID=138074 RepID=UPI000AA304DA